MKKRPQNIRLSFADFWRFLDGMQDVPGFFSEEESKKLQNEQKKFESATAYNYHRLDPALEGADWEAFYLELARKLFDEYEFLEITGEDDIFGVQNGKKTFLKHIVSAYTRALKLGK